MDVARRQIVEEPSLVGRIKTRRNLIRLTHAQIARAVRMGQDVIERAKSSSNSTSRFDGPLDWDFMYSLSGKNSSLPGLKSTVQVNSDDVFASLKTESGAFDDLLGGFAKGSDRNGSEKDDKAGSDFDDLLAGLGMSRSPFSDSDRHAPHIGFSFQPTVSASKTTSTAAEDPFKVFESSSAPMDSSSTSNITHPLEEISKSSPMAQPLNQVAESVFIGRAVLEREKSSSNSFFRSSTSRFNGPLDWDFMYSLYGENSSRPPVYEDHVPGLKSTVQVNSDDVFTSLKTESGAFDDLLGGFGKGSGRNGSEKDDKAGSDFDDLLAGLGRSTSPFSDSDRHAPHIGFSFQPTVSASKTSATTAEDPFKVFESTSAPMDSSSTSNITNPLEEISKSSPMAQPQKSSSNTTSLNFDFGSQSARTSNSVFGSSTNHHNCDSGSFNDLFTTDAARSNSKPRDAPFDLDFMYSGSGGNSSPSPIYAKPVYDNDVFDSVLGLKSTAKVNFDDDIVSPKTESGAFVDLLGGFGKEGIRER